MNTDIHAAFEAKYKASETKLADDDIDSEWRKIQRDDDSWEPLPHRKLARWVEEKSRAAVEARDAEIRRVREVRNESAEEWRTEVRLCRQTIAERDAEIAALRGEVMELPLCATEKYTLRVGQTYRFVPVAGCASCDRLAEQARESYPDAPTPQPPRFPWSEPQKIARQIRGDGGKERKG